MRVVINGRVVAETDDMTRQEVEDLFNDLELACVDLENLLEKAGGGDEPGCLRTGEYNRQ